MDNLTKIAVEEEFNKSSNQYLTERLSKENVRERQRIFSLIKKNVKFSRVLDIGCGPGTITDNLLSISECVYGIDISEGMVNIAKKRYKDTKFNDKVIFELGDAENLIFEDSYFDAVFCIGVLRYLPSWEKGLQEIYRVLKPNGFVVLTFYYRFSLYWFYMFFFFRPLLPIIFLLKKRPLKTIQSKYKVNPLPISFIKFKKKFRKIGFTNMKVQHSGFTIYPINYLFPQFSTFFCLKLESALYKSNLFGWLGRILIVKGEKL